MSAIVAILGTVIIGVSFHLTLWQTVGLMLVAAALAPYDK